MERCGRNVSTYYHMKKSQSENDSHYMTPNIQHSGKGEIVEMIKKKKSVVVSGCGKR